MNLVLPGFKVFQQIETVFVKPKVLEAFLPILAAKYSRPQLLTLIDSFKKLKE